MHPCCWGPFFQSILQALPFLALFAIGGKKLFCLLRPLLPFSAKKADSSLVASEVQPISVELEKPSCCGGQKIDFSEKS